MEEKDIPEPTDSIQEEKETPDSEDSQNVVAESKEERASLMFIRICRMILRLFERWFMKARQRRLAKRMNSKK